MARMIIFMKKDLKLYSRVVITTYFARHRNQLKLKASILHWRNLPGVSLSTSDKKNEEQILTTCWNF